MSVPYRNTQARNAIFGGSGIAGLQTKINLMGRMASVRREGAKVFTNPSGTASQAALMGWMGGVVAAATTGSMPALFTALAAPVGARTFAKGLTSRAFINFLAKETTANPALPATALSAAAQSSQTEEPIYTNRTRAYFDSRKQGKQMIELQGGWPIDLPIFGTALFPCHLTITDLLDCCAIANRNWTHTSNPIRKVGGVGTDLSSECSFASALQLI